VSSILLSLFKLLTLVDVNLSEEVLDFGVGQVLVKEELADLTEVVGTILGVLGKCGCEMLLLIRLRELLFLYYKNTG
jgi:predicted house-cleaning noncanonical NTP pyrophosphatase (MazG superfamily)